MNLYVLLTASSAECFYQKLHGASSLTDFWIVPYEENYRQIVLNIRGKLLY